jgi:hypothetical protein
MIAFIQLLTSSLNDENSKSSFVYHILGCVVPTLLAEVAIVVKGFGRGVMAFVLAFELFHNLDFVFVENVEEFFHA